MIEFQKLLRKTDKGLIAIVLVLLIFGTLMVYSATKTTQTGAEDSYYYLKKQLLALLAGIFIMIPVILFDYRKMKAYVYYFYGISVVLLLLVIVQGEFTYGASRWIEFGFFKIQPSEFSKIFVILILAAYLSQKDLYPAELAVTGKAFAALFPIMFLIYFQPDLGTTLVILAIFFGMLIAAGAKGRHFVLFATIAVFIVFLVLQFHLLKPYQMNRLFVFINPDMDTKAAGYNLTQAKIAIGSGGFWGKGLFSGTQTNLKFLPARHTDFIFAVIGEEFGFVGAMFLIFLYFALNSRVLRIAATSKDMFGTLVCAGIFSMWLFQILTNIGMNVGIMPITGIPLPFITSGGSSMWVNLIAVGLLLNVYRARYG